jgi:tripartite ATP-independent transporter DctP family solute receptor
MSHLKTILAGAAAAALMAGHAAAQEIVLRSADTHPEGYPTVEAVQYMSDLLMERSDGRIAIEVFHSRQLGEESDTIEQTQFGVIDMNRINMAPLNNIIPETSVPALPYIFRSIEHMRTVMDGEIGDEILAAFEEHDLVGLAYYDSGARSFYNSIRPIESPADLDGMKIRVQQSDLFISMIEALGANATPMPFGEVYSGLQTGVIDGAENNWPSYESTNHYQVAQYYSLDEHSMSPEVLVMSLQSWNNLSEEDQQLIRQAARDSVGYMRDLWDAREAEARSTVEAAGSVINEVDKQPFIDAMAPVYEQFVTDPTLQDLVARIQAVE